MTAQVDSDAHNERVLDDSFPVLLALRLHENAGDLASHSFKFKLSLSLGLLIRACDCALNIPRAGFDHENLAGRAGQGVTALKTPVARPCTLPLVPK